MMIKLVSFVLAVNYFVLIYIIICCRWGCMACLRSLTLQFYCHLLFGLLSDPVNLANYFLVNLARMENHIFSPTGEDYLWSLGFLDTHNPESL